MSFSLEDCVTNFVSTTGIQIVRNPKCKAYKCYGRGYVGETVVNNKEIEEKEWKYIQCPKCYSWFRTVEYKLLLLDKERQQKEEEKNRKLNEQLQTEAIANVIRDGNSESL